MTLVTEEGRNLLRGKDMQEIMELKRQGLGVRAISRLTGYDRKTVSKYLAASGEALAYGPREVGPGKLDPFKEYLNQRLQAGVWNAQVLLRELRGRDYAGGYTILKSWLQPQRQAAQTAAVRRFETPPGKQAQVDWGHLGSLAHAKGHAQLWGFTMTLGYSRRLWAEAATDQRLGTLLRMHEAAFAAWGGVPEEILYDRMRTVWTGVDERGEIIWNPIFLDFARYWGFVPRLCRPYRAQTKGKVEAGVKYVRRNFLCGLQGREPAGLEEFNAQLRMWTAEVANERIHGTTRERVSARWEADQFALQPLRGRLPYPFVDEELRKVARDAYVAWESSRYSVPWRFAGAQVWVVERGAEVEVRHGAERIAVHSRAVRRHQVVTRSEHHEGIPLGVASSGKTLIHIQAGAPVVEARPLAVYDQVAGGGAQ